MSDSSATFRSNGSMTRHRLRVFLLCALFGVLVSFAISVSVRVVRGHAPGLPPSRLAHFVGTPIGDFLLPKLKTDEKISWQDLNGDYRLIFFSDSRCSACDRAYPSLADASKLIPVLVIGKGDRGILSEKLKENGVFSPAVFDSLGQVLSRFEIAGLPSAVMIDKTGTILAAETGSRCVTEILEGQ